MTPSLFFKMYAPYAVTTQIQSGVPAAITLAQAALESGWGKYAPGNNFFGIKDQPNDNYSGPNQVLDTTEVINGQKISIKSAFRKYTTPQGSFNDHADFLKANSRYNSLFKIDINDFNAWAKGLKAAGYATDPDYANKLITLNNGFNLNQYTGAAALKKKL
jgi:flagellar protein FlgJ